MRMAERMQKYGFYASTFTAEELRYLDIEPIPGNGAQGPAASRPELALLRTKILRLAKLTPLKSIDEDQLDALIKLVRVVAALDAMERTSVMRTKAEGGVDPALAALAANDLEDL
jgi:hypothetical protein